MLWEAATSNKTLALLEPEGLDSEESEFKLESEDLFC